MCTMCNCACFIMCIALQILELGLVKKQKSFGIDEKFSFKSALFNDSLLLNRKRFRHCTILPMHLGYLHIAFQNGLVDSAAIFWDYLRSVRMWRKSLHLPKQWIHFMESKLITKCTHVRINLSDYLLYCISINGA